jgi:tetratricopeptide (TPR) repeat protein
VSALANGEVKGLLEIDGTFRGPGILWAYYQGGLMLGWIEREFGWPKVLEMIRLYGEDRGNAETVKRALGLSPEEFDARFLARCRALTESWKVRPTWSDGRLAEFRARSGKDPKDLAAHLDYAEACLQRGNAIDAGTALARARALAPDDPRLAELKGTLALRTLRTPDRGLELYREALAGGRDHYDLRMALGLAADRAGKAEEAVEHFRRAKLLFPRSAGPGGPRQALARILTGLGRPDDALRELEEVAALSETDVESRLALAGAYEDRGDAAAAARVLAEILDVLPVPPRGERNAFPAAEVHARHARALDGTGRPGEAADSFRLAVVVGRTFDPKAAPAVVAGWLVELARAARAAGRAFEARAALQDALRTDPGNAEAAELLRAMGGS